MKKITICLSTITLSFFLFTASYADEISELKEQMKQMQKQMEIMQEKIEVLEAQKKVEAKAAAIAKTDLISISLKEGLSIRTDDKAFDMKIGGRFYTDAAWFEESSKLKGRLGKIKDDAEMRTARFQVSGSMFENFIYKLEYDFATGNAVIKDAYLGVKNIPVIGTVMAGHFFEPFGLETLNSPNYITFMENGLVDTFAAYRDLGILTNNTAFNSRLRWELGLFRDADDQGRATSNEYNFSGRLTGLPIYEDDGKKLLHLGVAYTYKNPENTIQFRARPESHLAPYYCDTGAFPSKYANILDYEAALVYGPLSLQGEYANAFVDNWTQSSNAFFQGLYAYASYFVTGEYRAYSTKDAIFTRVRPLKNFSPTGDGFGAWELALRYSYLDLNDDNISGGIMSDTTLGVNWYLNPNMRIMLNYIFTNLNRRGQSNILMTRFQVDF